MLSVEYTTWTEPYISAKITFYRKYIHATAFIFA